MGNKNFIVINGKKYDTVTGKLLQDTAAVSKPVASTIQPLQNNTGVVDGFVRKPVKKPRSQTAQHSVKQVQKSQTLMRQFVKKPSTQVKKHSQSVKPSIQKSHLGVSARRSETAKQTPKSQHVQKFGTIRHRTSVIRTTADLPVANAEGTQRQTVSNNTHVGDTKAHRPTAAEKMIEAALANANSHTQEHSHHKKKRSKILKKLGISAKAAGMSSAILCNSKRSELINASSGRPGRFQCANARLPAFRIQL